MGQDRAEQGRSGQAELGWARPCLPERMHESQGSESVPELVSAGRQLTHQGIEVIAQQGPVVVDLPLQDDEQEEQPQQDVPQVAEDVVEGARRSDTRPIA